LAFLAAASVLCAVILHGRYGLADDIRASVFQVVSLMTATGYATKDFSLWPYAAQALLLFVMFIGGCAGSTSGGFKVVRSLIVWRKSVQSLQQAGYPHALIPVRLNREALPEKVVSAVLGFFFLYVFLFAAGTALLLVFEHCAWMTAVSASLSCLSTVGPGLGRVGPTGNYAWLSLPGKWTLIFLMLSGRLEFFSFLALFLPATWRK
jgi:trk system potassium uptake protein TrkH